MPAPALLCPFTGTPMRPWLTVASDWRRPDEPGDWQLWWSEEGQFGQVHPRPEPQAIGGFYDLADYHTHADARPTRHNALTRLMLGIAWRLDRGCPMDDAYWQAVAPAGAALDIGCGDGGLLEAMAIHMESGIGVEPDPRARARAAARGITALEGTAEDLPAKVLARRFDIITFMHVLEHCLDPKKALAQAAGLLNEAGRIVIEVPNNAALGLRQAGAFWRWLDVPRHLNFFTETSLRSLVTQAGLEVVRCDYDGYTRQFLPDWITDEARIEATLKGQRATPAWRSRHLGRALRLLARTALARPARKYDSVRLVCRRA